MENLAQALNSAMKEIDGIEKDMQVGNQNYGYKGVSDYEVKKLFKGIFQNNGLMLIPTSVQAKTDISRWEESTTYQDKTTVKQKQSCFTEVETEYLLLHTSGESVKIAGYGQGVDSQDKGAGKATTYAMKYALLYLTLTPTGKIDDSDNTHSEETTIPKTTPPPSKKPILKESTYKLAIASTNLQSLKESLTKYDLTNKQIIGISKRIEELKN